MIVITADQVDSRSSSDAAGGMLLLLNERFADTLTLPVDRNAGDELQAITKDGGTAFDIISCLIRDARWRIGVGLGPIRYPLPEATREASGPAFFAARDAVAAARRRPTRFAVLAAEPAAEALAATVQALTDPVITLLQQRTERGWELYELLESGLTRSEAAARLGISAQAVSSRAASAELWMDAPARGAIAALLDGLNSVAE